MGDTHAGLNSWPASKQRKKPQWSCSDPNTHLQERPQGKEALLWLQTICWHSWLQWQCSGEEHRLGMLWDWRLCHNRSFSLQPQHLSTLDHKTDKSVYICDEGILLDEEKLSVGSTNDEKGRFPSPSQSFLDRASSSAIEIMLNLSKERFFHRWCCGHSGRWWC